MQKILLISESENKDTAMKIIGSDVNYEIIHRTSLDENIIKCFDNELIIIFSDENSLHMQAVSAAEKTSLSVMLICGSKIFAEKSGELSPLGILVVPSSAENQYILDMIRFMLAQRQRILGIKREKNSAADEQQLIIRAKCTLIQYLKLTEPQAHKYIEKQSMDLRKTKLEIAQRILKTYEM
ncbi:MAG: ANTAR domain-containing response regulator [Oscillospiraceae bacterium]